METTFKLTDKVKVTQPQYAFFYYSRMFEKMGFKNKLENVVKDTSGIWEVFAISKNISQPDEILLGLSRGNQELLMSTKDVKLIETTTIKVKNLSNEKLLIAENPKSKKGSGMTLTEAIGELEKGYYICNQDEPKDIFYCLYCFDAEVVLVSNNLRMPFHNFKEDAKKDKSVWYIYQPEPLKNTTQQSRVELIEKQRLQIFQDDKTICELKSRNGNLTRIVNDQTERIEFMQHELKNYESAIAVLEDQNKETNWICDDFAKQVSNIKESRERLASKFTNWFIFLVLTNVVSIAWNLYLLFK